MTNIGGMTCCFTCHKVVGPDIMPLGLVYRRARTRSTSRLPPLTRTQPTAESKLLRLSQLIVESTSEILESTHPPDSEHSGLESGVITRRRPVSIAAACRAQWRTQEGSRGGVSGGSRRAPVAVSVADLGGFPWRRQWRIQEGVHRALPSRCQSE